MKISIVTAYHNRKDLLINTLRSISLEKYDSELEIIIVDDGSTEENKLSDINGLFPTLNIHILDIEQSDKWWVNPCIPFNKGFELATGDVIIIQNPECLHMGNIIKTVEENIEENKYMVFGCYSINETETTNIKQLNFDDNYITRINKIIHPIQQRCARDSVHSSWYQHSIFRPELLHFCSAITKKDLDELGGFDERFAKGIAKDDREFIIRIKRKKMNITQINTPFVLHQRHNPTNYNTNLTQVNQILMNQILKENIIKANDIKNEE